MQQTTNDAGNTYNVIEREHRYPVKSSKADYIPDSTTLFVALNDDHTDTVHITLYLQSRIKSVHTFILRNLLYDLDKSNIRPDAAKVLDSLATILKGNPELRIALSSHTDSRASDAYNIKLSERRAKSAVEWLIKAGIDRSRMVARWYGESRPLNGCIDGMKCTEAQHQENRRTEVTVLE